MKWNFYIYDMFLYLTLLPEDFANHRIFLKKSFDDVNTLSLLLEDVAIQDPRTYGRTLDTAQEVYNAKAEGSNQGVRNIVTSVWEGLQAAGKAAGNAIIHPIESSKKAGSAIVNAIKAIPQIPDKMSGAYEDFTYKRYEENLAIMQGRGLEAKHEFAASTTANGITIGIGAAGVVKAGTSAVKVLSPDVPDVKNLPDVKADVPNQTNRIPEGYEPDNDLLSNQRSKDIYDEEIIKSAEDISTAKIPRQANQPRNLQEQIAWNQVLENPQLGRNLPDMNYDNLTGRSDMRFPKDAGFQKKEAVFERSDGTNITIHYQYNKNTKEVYDMKITTEYMDGYSFPPQPKTPEKPR